MIGGEQFFKIYENDIKVRRAIKKRVFSSKKNNTDIKFQITSLSLKNQSELHINVKVSGRLQMYWGDAYSVDSKYRFRSSIYRNEKLRRDHITHQLKSYFKLWGVEGYWIECKKVKVLPLDSII